MLSAKYILIAKNTLQEYFIYRVNFFFWRLQVFITFVMFFSLWSAISHGQTSLGIYTIPQLYSYFVIGYILRALVFSTRTQDIGGDIQSGQISLLLIKPINTLTYYFSRDVIDKLFNLTFLTCEFIIILFVYRPILALPDFGTFLLFLLSLLISILLFFFYSLVISFITFWSDNAWSSRFLFGIVFVTLFSGQYIPLDFLPSSVSSLLNYTPYPYMYYYPLKIWLGQLHSYDIYLHLGIGILNCLFFYFLASFMWVRGKQKFQSYGN